MKGRTPEIKAPKFLTDLYRDLRDQRLLPLVILLLVAIPVVPFLLRDPAPAFIPPSADEGLAAAVADDALMVVSAPAGLRRHGERFSGRSPRDPFVDPNAPEESATESEGGPGVNVSLPEPVEPGTDPDSPVFSPGGNGTSVSPASPSKPSNPGGSSGGNSGQSNPGSVTLFRLKTTVRFGKAGSGVLHTFEDIPRMRGLPRERPIAVFIGASDDGSRAVFSISADAAKVSGEGRCSSGRPKDCQFLTLKPGKAVNIEDARRGVVWRLAVSSITLVESQVEVDNDTSSSGNSKKDDVVGKPVAEPVDPEVVEAASLSEVIGLYLLK